MVYNGSDIIINLTKDKILNLDKDKLEYIIYDEELTIEQWILVINQMSRFDFEDFDYETAYDYLNELIEEVTSLNELENIQTEMVKYKLKTDYIEKHIYNIKNNISEEPEETEEDKALFEYLDKKIESLPMEILEKARKESIKNNSDTEILDRAIKNKEKIKKLQEKEIRQQQKENRRFLFWNLVSSLFGRTEASKNTDSGLMPWEQGEVTKGNYEPYQFEEEELEEDDYYYEDD